MKKKFSSNNKDIEKARRLATIKKATEVQEQIGKRLGENIDIIEALDRSRESHP